MLDIIITHYNEPFEVGEQLLRILDLQRGVDLSKIGVKIIHDGVPTFPEEKLAGLKYGIEQICIPHGGVSRARNEGIDRSTADWIMFCDFDDTFTNIYALRDMLSILPCDFDLLWTQILVEDRTDGKDLLYLTPDRQKFVFVHGKIYRRQFLIDQGLRFNEGMSFQEDSLFNATITARVDFTRVGQIKTPMVPYVWIRRPSSVTNSGRDDEAIYYHFRRNLDVTAENEPDPAKYAGMVTRTAYDAYYMINGRRAGAEVKKKILAEFRPWIKERLDVFGDVPEDIMAQLVDVSRYELLEPDEKLPDDEKTVLKWLIRVLNRKEG